MNAQRKPGWALTLVPVALALVAACAAVRPDAPGPPWASTLEREHPLVGRIWDVGVGRFIDATALVDRLVSERFILLGEKHDNPDHHRLQAWTLRALIAAGRRPAVGFEMFTLDEIPAIARYLATLPADGAGLGEAVRWDQSGWPPWPMYRPIADAAIGAGLPIVATNLPRQTVQAVGRHGLAALDQALVAELHLDRPLSPGDHAALANEITASHCNMIPAAMVEPMIAVQRARDAQMAQRLAAAGARDGAVLIAGTGHVRQDRGVPAFLRLQVPGAAIASVAFLEVQAGETRPEGYAGQFGDGPFPVDFVWFTPRLEDTDPCEKFRAPLERLRRGE